MCIKNKLGHNSDRSRTACSRFVWNLSSEWNFSKKKTKTSAKLLILCRSTLLQCVYWVQKRNNVRNVLNDPALQNSCWHLDEIKKKINKIFRFSSFRKSLSPLVKKLNYLSLYIFSSWIYSELHLFVSDLRNIYTSV